MSEIKKSILVYQGNKYKLLPQLKKMFPENHKELNCYDLFGGSGTFSINVLDDFKKVTYGEIDTNILSILIYLQFFHEKNLILSIEKIIKENNLSRENKESFLRFRDKFNKSVKDNKIDPIELLVLSRYSFNGMIRFSRGKGLFNTSFGKRQWIGKERDQTIIDFMDRWKYVDIKPYPYDYNLRHIDPNGFYYIDPPYLITKAVYNKFWSESKEKELYEKLDEIDRKGGKFLLSNVLTYQGKENIILKNWMKSYNHTFLDLGKTGYILGRSSDNRDPKKTQEIIVKNY
mgnify:CR=1 FL=1